jgi:hypothetical protein
MNKWHQHICVAVLQVAGEASVGEEEARVRERLEGVLADVDEGAVHVHLDVTGHVAAPSACSSCSMSGCSCPSTPCLSCWP